MAVRFALGASRGTVVRQLMVEGLVLAAIGAALGLFIARLGTGLLRQTASELPRIQDVHIDMRLVLFTLGLGVLTTVLFALAPAVQATRRDPADALARGGRSHVGSRHLLQRTLVAAQVALAIVLLVGAGLLIRSFMRLQQVSPGFDPGHVLTFRMSASWAERADAVVARQARTIARLQGIPGVEAAAVSQVLPAGLDVPPAEFHIAGRSTTERTFSHGRSVSSGYFRTLGIPILQGNSCSDDQAGPMLSKALVTRSFVDRFFPGENPIGHAVTSPGFPPGTAIDIVGVAGDVRESGLLKAAEPVIYWCGYSAYWPDPFFLVRTNPARHVSIAAIRAALLEIEPNRAVYSVRPLADTLSNSVSQRRLNTILLALFAAMALLLAAMGVYGVLSQLVAGRRREIGVRMALGARPVQILTSVVAQAALVTGFGIAAGLGGAIALARFMATLVFGINTRDLLTFAIVPLVLAVVAAAATFLPARRAATIDPMRALRED
jgi:putative ABC transport system permease protein